MNEGLTREKPIRVLLVDDSPLTLEILIRTLARAPEIVVVGCAHNGLEALDLIPKVRPDVICTDLHMPVMDGLEFVRAVMKLFPLPVLVLSISVQTGQDQNIFDMLEAGALDIMAKPRDGLDTEQGPGAAQELIERIRVLSGVRLIGRRSAQGATTSSVRTSLAGLSGMPPRIIGIGASTGGPQAMVTLLKSLPADFALPLICVQHITLGFMDGLVTWLAAHCRLHVRTATEGSPPLPGIAYLPPDGRHLEVDQKGLFRCAKSHPLSEHRPSVDITFGSLAHHYGGAAVGVLLTGMGEDGANGLLEIARAGGLTITQDEASSIVFGMPKRAIELGAARQVLSIDQIGPALCALVKSHTTERTALERNTDELDR